MLSRDENWLLEEKYNGVQSAAFLRDCKRLAASEPIDYVIGLTSFLGCHIDLSEHPLIPRVETEWWVEKILDRLRRPTSSRPRHRTSQSWALDMFAGSGCIGIALLKHLVGASVDFVDIEEKCIRQIEKNCALNDIAPDRFRMIQSDMFEGLQSDIYDVIVANPPYVSTSYDTLRVGQSVLQHEPHEALFSGEDGLDHIRSFLIEASKHLTPEGFIAMEFDDIQKDDIDKFITINLHGTATFYRDQYGRYRWLIYSRA